MLDLLGEANALAIVGLIGGIALGLAARLGRFCTLGAIEDALYGSDDRRLRMWGLAIGTATVAVHLAHAGGLFDLSASLYLSQGWNPIASVLGGLLFGYGMALSGNCGFGALARLGGGDLRAFVVVIVMGLSAFVVLSGPLASLRVWLFPPDAFPGLPSGPAQLLDGRTSAVILGVIVGLTIIAVTLAHRKFRQSPTHVFWGLVVGLAIASGWVGTYWIAETGFAAEPVQSHTFTAPIGDTIIYAMTASGNSLSFAVGSVLGVIVGACLGSFAKGHFRWEACEDPRELRRQISGAAIMGAGAVLALGCSVGQGISAFSVLAFSAPVTVAAIFVGASIGLRQLIEGFAPAE